MAMRRACGERLVSSIVEKGPIPILSTLILSFKVKLQYKAIVLGSPGVSPLWIQYAGELHVLRVRSKSQTALLLPSQGDSPAAHS